MNTSNENKDKKPKIFISHSKDDEKYVKNLVYLLEDIGLSNNDIFCSLFREYGIPIGEDIYEYLRNELKSENVTVFYILSNNYYDSPACLNEMGASWMVQSEYITFLLPSFEFKEIKGAINPNKISISLDSNTLKEYLNELKNNLCHKFNITILDNKWERVRDKYLDTLSPNNKTVIDGGTF